MTAQDQESYESFLTTSNVKTLLSWQSPARPWKRRGKSFYINAVLITALISVIIFLFSEYVLITTVWALTFAAVVLASIKPHDITHRISNQGITISQHSYLWTELYDFYFKKQFGQDVLHVRTHAIIPGELVLTLGPLSKNQVREAIVHYLPYRESVERNFIEKSGDWLSRTFPLEKN